MHDTFMPRSSPRCTVQPASYKDTPFVNAALPRTIYRRSSLPKRKRSRWPLAKRPTGPGGRSKNPIVLRDDDEEEAGGEPPSPCGSSSTRQYGYEDRMGDLLALGYKDDDDAGHRGGAAAASAAPSPSPAWHDNGDGWVQEI